MAEQSKSSVGHKLSLRLGLQYLLSCYYFTILVVSLFFSIKWILYWNNYDIKCIIFRGIALSALGNSLYYSRKLYKNSINMHFHVKEDPEFSSTIEIGTLSYYILRPFFSVATSTIFFLLIAGEIIFISDKLPDNLTNFAYFFLSSSFFIGLSTGKVIEKVLNMSKSYIKELPDKSQ